MVQSRQSAEKRLIVVGAHFVGKFRSLAGERGQQGLKRVGGRGGIGLAVDGRNERVAVAVKSRCAEKRRAHSRRQVAGRNSRKAVESGHRHRKTVNHGRAGQAGQASQEVERFARHVRKRVGGSKVNRERMATGQRYRKRHRSSSSSSSSSDRSGSGLAVAQLVVVVVQRRHSTRPTTSYYSAGSRSSSSGVRTVRMPLRAHFLLFPPFRAPVLKPNLFKFTAIIIKTGFQTTHYIFFFCG